MKEMLVSIQHSAPCISPFEGITSPFASLFPPFEGGAGGGCSSAFGLLSFRANTIRKTKSPKTQNEKSKKT
uniref:hypothetical protein n=1 Tax=Tannerella forsythia TaxID=28112 RepID=UPI0028E97D73